MAFFFIRKQISKSKSSPVVGGGNMLSKYERPILLDILVYTSPLLQISILTRHVIKLE
jgi:hypothetical protein